MLKAGHVALLYPGVAVNLLALRHEICTVLVIEDPRWCLQVARAVVS
jgi:hypothetical protein